MGQGNQQDIAPTQSLLAIEGQETQRLDEQFAPCPPLRRVIAEAQFKLGTPGSRRGAREDGAG